MSSAPESTQKRSGKRYSYPRPAQCDFNSQTFEIQILNISSSGIQFAVRVKIDYKKSIHVQWKDQQFGNFDIHILLAREVHKPENKEFQYYYGSQYYNLSTDAKERLINLLRHFKAEEQKLNQLQVQKSSPEYIFEVIDQGAAFLRKAFNGGEPDPYFENILKQIVDYEKTSFLLEDPISQAIQKLVTHNFHCNLLGILSAQVAEKEDLKAKYFENIKMELEKINQIENDVDAVIKKLRESSASDEEKANIQRRLNESSNRLFYTKQSLLQSVVETFASDTENLAHMESLGKIVEEYEKILEFTSSSAPIESLTYKRRTREHADEKIKDVIDVPVMSDQKPSSVLWLGSIFTILLVLVLGSLKILQLKDKLLFKDKIDFGTDIESFRKYNTQAEVRIKAEKWNALPVAKKEQVFAKIVAYLKEDKGAMSCIIFDENMNILHLLYEESLPGNLRVNPAQNVTAAAAPPATSVQKTAEAPVESAPVVEQPKVETAPEVKK